MAFTLKNQGRTSSGVRATVHSPQLILVTGFVFVISLVIAGCVLSFRSEIATSESRRWVEHTYEVISSLDKVILNLTSAETSRRGYGLTHDESFLEPCRDAMKRTEQELANVKRLTADNPAQQQRLAGLEPMVRERFDSLNEAIEATRTGASDRQHEVNRTLRGSKITKSIQSSIATMQQEERNLLDQRTSAEKQSAEHTARIILLSNSALLALLLAVGSLIFHKLSHEDSQLAPVAESSSPKPWLGYIVAILATTLAAGLRWGLGVMVGPSLPAYITFYPVIMISALIGGVGSGLLATVVSAIAAAFLFLSPPGSVNLDRPADQVGMVLFCGINVAVSIICGALRTSRARILASEQRLRATFDQAAMGILEVDTNDRFVEINQRVCQILGYSRQELLGMSIEQLTHPEDRLSSLAFNREIHEGLKARVDYEKRYLKRDGSALHVHVAVSPLRDFQGRDLGAIGTFEDITERKRAEESLKASEQRYRSFVEASAQVIWRINAKGEVDQPIPSWNKFTGQSDEEASGFGWMNVIHPEDRPRVTGAWIAASQAKTLYQVEYRLKPHGRKWLDILARGVPVLGENGSVCEYIGTCIDITKQKEAEAAIRRSERRFRTLTEVSTQVVWISTPEGEPAGDSPSWRTFTGRSLEQWMGWTWLDAVHPGDRQRVAQAWRQALEKCQPYRDQYRLMHVSGVYREVLARAVPVRNAAGTLREWVGTLEDITGIKRAEAATATLASIIADSDDAIIGKDLEGTITSWNRGAELIFGYKAEEVLGKNVRLLLPQDRQAEEDAILAKLRAGQKIEHYESQRLTRDGRLIEVSLTSSPVRDANGQIVGASKIARDITERKRAEEVIRQRSLLSEAVNRLFREALECETEERLGNLCLTVAEDLTQSPCGFMGAINDEGRLDDIAISDPGSPTCKRMIKEGHTGYRIIPTGFEIHGIYGRVLLDGKGFFTNDPLSHPDRAGLPEGHAMLSSFLGTPLVQGDQKIGLIALANRAGGYSQKQLEALEELAMAITQVLMRFRAEQALRQAQAQMRVITDQMSAGVTRCSRDERYLWVSPAYARWLGRSPKEIAGRPIRKVIGEPGYEVIRPHIEQVLTGQSVQYEAEVDYLGVGKFWINAVYTPTYDAEEAVDGWIAVVNDITERKQAEERRRQRAEEALRLSEEEFHSLAEAVPQIVWATRPDGWNIYFNQQWVDYTGMTLEESSGHGWNKPFHPDDQQRAWEAWQRATQNNERYSIECRLRRHDGVYRWWLIRGEPMRGANGEILKWFGTCTDIEEIKRNQAQLQEMVVELEHFSYTITHDMRAPLRAMRGLAGVLVEDCGSCLHDEQRDYLQRIAQSADRMDQLITDSLQYSKIVSGQFDLEPVDADALLRGMLESYPHFQQPRANINIRNRLPVVLGNKAGLTQCLSNLLSNAVKFVHPGQTPEVVIWAEQLSDAPELGKQESNFKGEAQASLLSSWHISEETAAAAGPVNVSGLPIVRIWFEDKGIGIEKEYQERIWVMFQRLNTSYSGTGIGLALVRKAVERMGGRVGLESEPGKGSRFWVELRTAPSAPHPIALLEAAHHE